MARLLTTGFEVRRFTTAAATNGEGQATLCTGAPTFDTAEPWSGTGWMKCAKAAQNLFNVDITGVAGRTYYAQVVVKLSDVLSAFLQEGLVEYRHAGGTLIEFAVEDTGSEHEGEFVIIKEAGGAEEFHTGIFPTANTPYILELAVTVPAAGNGSFAYKIRDEDGNLLAEASFPSVNLGTAQVARVRTGHGNSAENESDIHVAQFIVNDGTGEDENSWVGPQKVAMLKPTVDGGKAAGFLNGAGGGTNLYKALDNYPPAGVANASKTAESQIYSLSNNNTDDYNAECPSYDTPVAEGGGGLSAGDEVKVVMGIARGGYNSTTSRLLAVRLTEQPATEEATKSSGTTTAAAEPTGWTTLTTEAMYADPEDPELTGKPIVRVRKGTATTTAIFYDMVGVYVSYLPEVAGAEPVTLSLSTVAAQSSASANLKATTGLVPSPVVNTSSPTVALSAKTQLSPGPVTNVSLATSALATKVPINAQAVAGVSSVVSSLRTAAQITALSSGVSNAVAQLMAKTQLPLSPVAAVAVATANLQAQTGLPMAPVAAQASTSAVLRTPLKLAPVTAVSTATLLALGFKPKLVLSPVAGVLTPTLVLTRPTKPGYYVRIAGKWEKVA